MGHHVHNLFSKGSEMLTISEWWVPGSSMYSFYKIYMYKKLFLKKVKKNKRKEKAK